MEWQFNEVKRSVTPMDYKDVVSFILQRVGKENRQVFRFRTLPMIGTARPETGVDDKETIAPREIGSTNPEFRTL
jgi:hypothetical protein